MYEEGGSIWVLSVFVVKKIGPKAVKPRVRFTHAIESVLLGELNLDQAALDFDILTVGGVEIEESVELTLGEDDRALVRFPEPDCTTGGEANGEEDGRSQ